MPGVSQISPPMRIVLGVAVAFVVVYLVALRPKAEVAPPAPAVAPAGNVNTGKPAVTGAGKAVQAAKRAAAATEAQQAAEGAAAGVAPAPGSTTAAKPAAKPAAAKPAFKGPAVDTTGLPKPVARAIHRHDVLALLFTNETSPDDRAVEAGLRKVARSTGGLYADAAPIGTIARYGPITRGADVQQSPTVVIVDRRMRATTLVGYVDPLTIRQAVVDAMRASGGLLADPYLRRVNKSCSAAGHDIVATPQATTAAQSPAALRARVGRFDGFVADLRGTPAPARWRAFNRHLIADATALQALLHQQLGVLGAHPTAARVRSVRATITRRGDVLSKRFTSRADAHHLIFCGSLS
jgi:hypothetical protein